MFDVLSSLPAWLVWGIVLGAAASILVAATFVVGTRVFPTERAPGPSHSGDSRRRAEIREYLSAIGEAFAEDHPVEGQSVAFYLPERDVAITFDPRAYYRIERSESEAVLVEHELPGVHLGTRLPFETPTVAFDEPGAHGDDRERVTPKDAAFTILDLPEAADTEQVKAAYRRKVKEVHPDHGGDPEEFKRVREAYATAQEHAAD